MPHTPTPPTTLTNIRVSFILIKYLPALCTHRHKAAIYGGDYTLSSAIATYPGGLTLDRYLVGSMRVGAQLN